MKAFSLCILSCFLLLVQFPFDSFAQWKQANNWYFGQYAGISFQNGSPPVVILNGQTNNILQTGTVSMSDDDGNLIFYSNGITVWNRNHQVMTNGTNMGFFSTGGGVVVKKPGVDEEYYLFNYSTDGNLQYSVIDMSDGLGFVREYEKGIVLQTNTTWHLGAIMHENMTDSWLLTHELGTNRFLAFSVTADGINTVPVISNAGSNVMVEEGYMKFSTNAERVVLSCPWYNNTQLFYFNNQTGQVSNDNVITFPPSSGVEFSPNNRRFYTLNDGESLYQYDLIINDQVIILLSGVQLTNEALSYGALQLGPDGKIYVGDEGGYLSVIHNPNNPSLSCNFQYHAIYLEGRTCTGGLPTFNQSILRDYSFSATQFCYGEPTMFSILNTDGIDSVLWHFHDPSGYEDISREFNPSYTYSHTGSYSPSLTVYSGFITRTVTQSLYIQSTPYPFLGNDTIICQGAINLTVDAGPGDVYNWNGSTVPGERYYSITQPGTYYVSVTQEGCSGYDTIVVTGKPVVETIIVTDETCGQQNGSISILPATGEVTEYLYSLNNGVFSNSNYFAYLSAGVYQCTIMNGLNCLSDPLSATIANMPGVLIDTILTTPEADTTKNGTITVIATGNGILIYELEGYAPQNSNVFTDLSAGTYNLHVTDEPGCISAQVIVVPRENSSAINETPGSEKPIRLPGVITINSGSKNSAFNPIIDDELVRSFNMAVYNIQGQLQFMTNSSVNCWLPRHPGIYTWMVIYTDIHGVVSSVTGKVLVTL